MSESPNRVGRGWRVFFFAAGVLNVVGGGAILANVEGVGLATRPPFVGQLLGATVVLFGLGFFMVWRRPLQHRGIVWLGLGSKLLGLVFTYVALADGQLPPSAWPQPLLVDLPWAVGFAWFLWRFRSWRFRAPSHRTS